MLQEVEDTSSGQTRQRLVNRARFAGVGQQTIGHGHAPGDVPQEPIKSVKQRMKDLDQDLLQKLRVVRAKTRSVESVQLIRRSFLTSDRYGSAVSFCRVSPTRSDTRSFRKYSRGRYAPR